VAQLLPRGPAPPDRGPRGAVLLHVRAAL